MLLAEVGQNNIENKIGWFIPFNVFQNQLFNYNTRGKFNDLQIDGTLRLLF